ncbi:uncharacterized protein LOC113633890 [Tachysurus ichikawai]
MLCRVIISPQNIQKVRLDTVPDSVDGLKFELKSRLQLKDPFDLQYEDEDFHDFCNLTCVADLPKDKPWPTAFPIPIFTYDVELRLRQGNEAFRKDGTLLSVPRDMKIDILTQLAETIYSYKDYPVNEEIDSVAAALIEKHPFLKEPSSASGWYE